MTCACKKSLLNASKFSEEGDVGLNGNLLTKILNNLFVFIFVFPITIIFIVIAIPFLSVLIIRAFMGKKTTIKMPNKWFKKLQNSV